jgi:hypothetical protein
MQAVGVILFLISIGTVVAPVGAVVLMYRDNLTQLVVPPEITDIINGNSPILQQDLGISGGTGPSGPEGAMAISVVDKQIDAASRTFTITVNFTNPLNLNFTLNTLAADVQCSEHNYPLGSVGLNGAVEIPAGKASLITVMGFWTQDAENHFLTEHAGKTAINVNLVNVTIDLNGIVIQQNEPINIGDVPLIGW